MSVAEAWNLAQGILLVGGVVAIPTVAIGVVVGAWVVNTEKYGALESKRARDLESKRSTASLHSATSGLATNVPKR